MEDNLIDNDEDLVGCDCEETDSEEGAGLDIAKVLDGEPISKMSASTTIKYAPVLPPVKGEYTLYAVALKWLDNPGEPLSHVSNACNQAAKVYKELSNGYLNFKVIARVVKVDFNHAAKNIPKAEKQAKNALGKPAAQHVYCMFNNHAKNFSNGSGDTAHLLGTLTRDVLHEVGHCRPTQLGHSGAYKDGKLAPYDDGTSFMGRFASTRLTGAQLYLLGWLPENKVAQYDIGGIPTQFDVCSLFADNSGQAVKVVLIPRGEQRPLYLSRPQIQGKPTLCLHLSSGRGTQRVAVFGSKAQYDNLLFEKVADGDGFVTVRVSMV